MIKDIVVYIEDIVESIQKIKEYTSSLTEEEFNEKESIQDAILMRLTVIGESANKIPLEVRNQYKTIAWRKIINLRNIIVHSYSSVNIERVWRIIKTDIPIFQKQMNKLLKDRSTP